MQDMALIIFVDYDAKLSDLRKLSGSISVATYRAVYLIAVISQQLKDFMCVTLKNPSDKLGPVSVKFNRPDGKPDVSRMHE